MKKKIKNTVLMGLFCLSIVVLLICCSATDLYPAAIIGIAVSLLYIYLFAKANGFWMK